MEGKLVIEALSALAQHSRLEIFRLLITAGRDGLSAGEIGRKLAIPANSLSFHLTRLRYAGLLTGRREGRQIFYAANFGNMRKLIEYLTDNCCESSSEECSPVCPKPVTVENKRLIVRKGVQL
ncbi:MAG: metalloregulator ArsR/SmtB family transcription factor [SAR324 cluster bacterium]|nr:metalloregulator ArsR/SmtB family transcription factor [SAR324 cluster bacterium]